MPDRSSFLDRKPEEATPTKVPVPKSHPIFLELHTQSGCITKEGYPPLELAEPRRYNPHLHGNDGAVLGGEELLSWLKSILLLSPDRQQLVKSLVQELLKLEGVKALEIEPEPLGKYIPAWQNSLSRFTSRSKELYRYYVERLLTNMPPPITTIALEGYIASRREKVSPNALKNELKAAKSFFRFLHDRDIIALDPASKVEHPRIVKRQKTCPSDDEVTKFLSALAAAKNPKAEMMIFLFINTGLRFTEIATLNWGRVDFENLKINALGKGGKVRRVPMAAWLSDFLAKLRKGHSDDELLFPSESKKGTWDNSDANKMIARLCQKAGIKRYSCHQFRHYFANYTLRGTGEKGLKAVQEMLGHASAATTLDYYIHTDEKEIEETHERFAPLSGEGPTPREDKGGGNHGKTH